MPACTTLYMFSDDDVRAIWDCEVLPRIGELGEDAGELVASARGRIEEFDLAMACASSLEELRRIDEDYNEDADRFLERFDG